MNETMQGSLVFPISPYYWNLVQRKLVPTFKPPANNEISRDD